MNGSTEVLRAMRWGASGDEDLGLLLSREWLVTNGLGGYASGTVGMVPTRRFHGLLIAALPAPLGRVMMLHRITELFRFPDGDLLRAGGEEREGQPLEVPGTGALREFRLGDGLPVWLYEHGGFILERTLFLPHAQNSVHIIYRVLAGEGVVRLKVQLALQFRPHEASPAAAHRGPLAVHVEGKRQEISAGGPLPPLRLLIHGERTAFTLEEKVVPAVHYRVEARRGYEATGAMASPGYFRVDIAKDHPAALIASTEGWDTILAMTPEEARRAELERRKRLIAAAPEPLRSGPAAELVLAADQFVIQPAGRVEDAARARAAGDEVRTIIAGYHWFTDWGRDTMISLEGLTLATGRAEEARYILRTFAHYVKDGLIPNLFPEGEREGLYHTADATLWFFHAIARYVGRTGDRATLRILLPRLRDIAAAHFRGTRFGIGVDPTDGLLRQGAEGYQLTWMDAKVGDWVVTPRRGKAVELNALWYNALRLLAGWLEEEGETEEARGLAEHAERSRASFNRRFWYEAGGHLHDVVDGEKGDDPSLRPNQVLAIALDHPVLDPARWGPVLEAVRENLLTPVGLRSLAPGHPDYRPTYDGDLRARDAAYHQGTVWAWLAGPFVDAWLRVHPEDRKGAARFLAGFVPHLGEACLGTISEVFDAEEPYTPRGCVAQAWSVAEVLRAWLRTGGVGE